MDGGPCRILYRMLLVRGACDEPTPEPILSKIKTDALIPTSCLYSAPDAASRKAQTPEPFWFKTRC